MVDSLPNNTDTSTPQASSVASPTTSKAIIEAFIESKKKLHKDYVELGSKQYIAKEFSEFVKSNYPNGVLETLLQDKGLSEEFNKYAHKGFTVKDFLSASDRSSTIKQQVRNQVDEPQAMNDMVMNCYQQRKKLTDDEKKQIPFQKFLDECGLKEVTNPDGDITAIRVKKNSKAQSCQDIEKKRQYFVTNSVSSERQGLYLNMMQNSFDPTEKIVCISTLRELYNRIQKIDGPQRNTVNAIRKDIFDEEVLGNQSVSSLHSWTSLAGLESALKEFFDTAANNGLSKEDIDDLKNISIDPKTCIFHGDKMGELPKGSYEVVEQNKRFSEMNNRVRSLTSKLSTTHVINNVEKIAGEYEKASENVARVFSLPGNMKGFFDQFSDKQQSIYNSKVPENKRKEYAQLQKSIDAIKEELSNADGKQRGLLLQRLHETQSQKKNLESDYAPEFSSEYFQSIADAVAVAHESLGRVADDGYKHDLITTLEFLRSNNWDASKLSSMQNNVLLKASVVMQLAKVKESGTFLDLNYNFQEYAQFVEDLFDVNKKQSIISTKDGNTIQLNFVKKGLVGKPYDWQSVSLNSLQDLQNLRFECQVDLHNNPDAEQFIKAVTGGAKSPIIRKFFGNIEGGNHLPKTITDSSRVKMKNKKTGQIYQGYLSPVMIQDGDEEDITEGVSDEVAQSTFVLYDKQADQLHDDRSIVSMGSDSKTPVYINTSTMNDWEIDVDDNEHIAVLAGDGLNALALGHLAAQDWDSKELSRKAYAEGIEKNSTELERSLDNLYTNKSHDNIQHADESVSTTVTSGQETQQQFNTHWAKLFAGTEEVNKGPRVGQQFAFPLKKNIYYRRNPSNEKDMMKATVKEVKADGSVVLDLSYLTMGNHNNKRKTMVVDPSNIESITDFGSDQNPFQKSIYLGDAVQSNFEDLKKNIAEIDGFIKKEERGVRNNLSMDGKGSFCKGKDKVTTFITPVNLNDGLKNPIKYTVSHNSKGEYTITSTGYEANISSDSSTKAIETIGDTVTTDLSGLMIYLSSRKVQSHTDEEHKNWKNFGGNTILPDNVRKKMRTPSTLWSVVKGAAKKVWDGGLKKLGEDQEKELQYMLFNEGQWYRRLDNKFGWLLEKFDANVLDDLADEAESSGLEYARSKIEGYQKHLEKFHHGHNANVPRPKKLDEDGNVVKDPKTGKDMEAMSGASQMAAGMIRKAWIAHNNGQRTTPKQRRKVAGAMMYCLTKFKNGYPKEVREISPPPIAKGAYIKMLFGDEAYRIFTEQYASIEKKVDHTKEGRQYKEQLMALEYNFMVDNMRGGSSADARVMHANGRDNYYMNMYSRKFCNTLGTVAADIKNVSVAPDTDDAKNAIASNNFGLVQDDCRGQLKASRMSECLPNLSALQKIAAEGQGNEVFYIIMAGILNGVFVHNLGFDTKEQLKGLCRNCSIPFPAWIERPDAQQRVQRMLDLATGGKFSKEFAHGKPKKHYDASDFTDFGLKKDVASFTDKFREYISSSDMKDAIKFLHMDNLNVNDMGDENLISIRKWDGKEKLIINGLEVTAEMKADVDAMMGELHFNDDKGADLAKYNFSPGFPHTHTTIQNFFRNHNTSIRNGKYEAGEGGKGDHLEVMRGSVSKQAPNPGYKITDSSQQYKLAYNVNEFFRVFQGVGDMKYDKGFIAGFYKRIRLAQSYSDNPKEMRRILWFYTASKVYARGALPNSVEEAFTKYMQYFENNIMSFSQNTGQYHSDPGDGGKNLGYAFEEPLDEVYIPQEERSDLLVNKAKMADARSKADVKNYTILNQEMQDANKNARGKTTKGYQSEYGIGATLDAKIAQLNGEGSQKKKVRYAKAANASDVNMPVSASQPPSYQSIMPEKLNPEDKKKREEEERIREDERERLLQE